MNELKYIVVERHDTPVIFPSLLDHCEVAHGLGKIISAGFVLLYHNKELNKLEVRVWGKSLTLEIESREIDAKLIERSFFTKDDE